MDERIKDIAKINPDDPQALREAKTKLAAIHEARVSDDGMKAAIPFFVKGRTAGEDHKCGGCKFRMGSGNCALVFGTISFPNGVCTYWSPGDKPADHRHDAQMSQSEAGYVEVANGVAINCASCARYRRGESFCRLWEGDVDPEDCCISYKPGSRVMAEKK